MRSLKTWYAVWIVWTGHCAVCRILDDRPPSLFNPHLKEMVSRSVAMSLTMDGHLNDAAWQASDVAAEFITAANKEPMESTLWVVCHDHTSIFFAFLCKDDDVVASERMRDSEVVEDSVEIRLVTDGRLGNDFSFRVNARGSRWDAKRENVTWNAQPDWQCAARRMPGGWTAEVAIPFASLGEPNLRFGEHGRTGCCVWFVRILRTNVRLQRATGNDAKEIEISSWTRFGRKDDTNSAVYGILFFEVKNHNLARRIVRMMEPDDPHAYIPHEGATIQRVSAVRLSYSWPVEPAASLYELQISRCAGFPAKGTYSYVTPVHEIRPGVRYVPGRWFWRYRMRTYDGKVSAFSRAYAFDIR